MLGTFPKDFSQVVTSKGCFPKRQLSKCAISQAATSQFRPQPVLVLALDPLAHPSRSARPPLQPAAPQKAESNLWEVAAWEIAHLGSCHWKIPLGSSHLV